MDMIVSPRGIVDIERPGQGVLDLSQAGFGQALTLQCFVRIKS